MASPHHVPLVLLARFADGPIWLVIAATCYVIGGNALRAVTIKGFVAVLTTAILVTAIKFTLRRERPRGAESASWTAMPSYDRHSFPSGHAARMASIATIATAAETRLLPAGILLTVAVALARVALGIHYLLDVAVGMLVGLASSFLILTMWH
jgi:undecaprenyl-diphosphatase